MLVVLAICGWTLVLFSVGIHGYYVMHLSFFYACDLFLIWVMNAFPLVTKLHNQKTLKNPKNPVLFYWNIWDYVGLFSCSLETISGINRKINNIQLYCSSFFTQIVYARNCFQTTRKQANIISNISIKQNRVFRVF